MIPPPPQQDRGALERGRGGARLHAPSRLLLQEPQRTSKPAPAHKDATRTTPGDSKRARTGGVWGPSPPWPDGRQGHLLCCLPREGRGTDRGKATPRPTGPPSRAVRGDGAQAAPPPQPQPAPRRWNAPGAQTNPTGSAQPPAR